MGTCRVIGVGTCRVIEEGGVAGTGRVIREEVSMCRVIEEWGWVRVG